MPSPLDIGRAVTRAGSSRSSTSSATAARSPQAPQQAASQAPGPANGHGDAQQDQEQGKEQEHPRQEQHQEHQGRQHSSYRHHGTRAGYRPAQVRRLPFDMSAYAHFMLMHTKHQMDAVPNAEPPPAHLSIAGLPRDYDTHAGHRDHRDSHPNSRASTADPSNGISS